MTKKLQECESQSSEPVYTYNISLLTVGITASIALGMILGAVISPFAAVAGLIGIIVVVAPTWLKKRGLQQRLEQALEEQKGIYKGIGAIFERAIALLNAGKSYHQVLHNEGITDRILQQLTRLDEKTQSKLSTDLLRSIKKFRLLTLNLD